MATITQVAERANVSIATVSRAFNKPNLVDVKTRARIMDAVKELGYRPNQVARGLASRSSRTIGVIVNRFASSYYGRMLEGAERELRTVDYKTIAESSGEAAEGERAAWESLLDRQCEVVIVHSDALEDDELLQLAHKYPSSVFMNRRLDGVLDRCVHLDNVRGGALAADYLMGKGHRSFACITGPLNYYEARDRLTGFQEGLAANGIELKPENVREGTFLEVDGYTCMLDLLDHGTGFSAIFCQSDEMAAGAMEACRERGVKVPEDLSMIGFDDLDVARYLTPKLTTIRQPLWDIGAAAGKLAYALATGQKPSSDIQTVFLAEVVERASVFNKSLD